MDTILEYWLSLVLIESIDPCTELAPVSSSTKADNSFFKKYKDKTHRAHFQSCPGKNRTKKS